MGDRVRREQLLARSNRCACGWGDLLEGNLEFGFGRDPVGDEFGRSRLPDATYSKEVRFRHAR